jgi:interferon gamma-inducible protein 30
MKVLLLNSALFLLLFSVDCHHVNNRLSIYYESICPDSRRFVLDQLIPTYDKLNQYLDIDLVPFGNANVSYPNHDFNPYFQCQHGPNECYGNKAHACVIDMTKSTRPTLNFIKCMFEADNWKQTQITSQKCGERLNLNMTHLNGCIEGPEGDRLLLVYSYRTFNLEPQHKSVPWIIIDGKNDTSTNEIQRQLAKNLLKYLCDTYHNNHEPKLSQCRASESVVQKSQLSSSLRLENSFIILIITLITSSFC